MAGWIALEGFRTPAGPRLADQFDLLSGLPVHPMAVYVAVVLLPLTSLSLVAIVVVPKLRRTFGWLVMFLLAVSVGAAYLAQQSGTALAIRLGRPQDHARLGSLVVWFTAVQFALGFIWFLTARIGQRQASRTKAATAPAAASDPYGGATGGVDPLTGAPFAGASNRGSSGPAAAGTSPITIVLGAFAVMVAAMNLFLAYQVGRSGMTATWQARVAQPGTTANPSVPPIGDVQPGVIPPSGIPTSEMPPSTLAPSQSGPSEIQPSGATPGSGGPGASGPPGVTGLTPAPPLPTASASASAAVSAPASEFGDPAYTLGEVAIHNRAESCWVVAGSKVYDLTSWLPTHPESAAALEELCGTDVSGMSTAAGAAPLLNRSDLSRLQIGVLE